jgi:hypothetical protein
VIVGDMGRSCSCVTFQLPEVLPGLDIGTCHLRGSSTLTRTMPSQRNILAIPFVAVGTCERLQWREGDTWLHCAFSVPVSLSVFLLLRADGSPSASTHIVPCQTTVKDELSDVSNLRPQMVCGLQWSSLSSVEAQSPLAATVLWYFAILDWTSWSSQYM